MHYVKAWIIGLILLGFLGCLISGIWKGRRTVPRRKQVILTILFLLWIAFGVWYFIL